MTEIELEKAIQETIRELPKEHYLEVLQEFRLFIAGKLYDSGKITCSQAAKIAQMPRIEFLEILGKYGFRAINIDGEEIEAEVKRVKELYDISYY